MNMRTLIRQTVFLSGSHLIVRVMGFAMRIWLSRELGAQAMGIVELAGSVQMLLITPVVSGLPAAVSRMCARTQPQKQVRILRTGLLLVLLLSLPIAAVGFLLRVPLSLWLGDLRTLPALIVYLPCIPVLGVSCVLNGYYYGTGRPVPPALCELLEQIVRFLLCIRLTRLFSGWPLMIRSAIPALGTLAGETASLLLMLFIAARALIFCTSEGSRRAIACEMLTLALPLTGMKLVSSLMRTVQSTLLPARLQAAGLPAAESIAQLGMLNGMMMPVLMIPSFITCSLCMVSAPELARRQAQGKKTLTLARRILAAALAVGTAAMLAVFAFAPLIADRLYRQAELLPLLRRSCALVPVMTLNQVSGGMMNGLGLQGKSLKISLITGFLHVLLMYALAAQPALMLHGAVIALSAAQLLTLLLSLRALRSALK